MWIPCFIPLYSPLNLYLIILWILDFRYILLLLLLLHAFIHLNTPISAVLCVHVASSVFSAVKSDYFTATSNTPKDEEF